MAVENQTPPTQPASPAWTTFKELTPVLTALTGLAAVIIAGTALVVSLTVAPLREDLRLLRQDMQRGFETVDMELKAVHRDIAEIRERLTRVETLLQQGADQAPETPPAD